VGRKARSRRKVRISCVRTKRLLLYRIADPGEGFDIDRLRHAAIMNRTTIRCAPLVGKNRASAGGFGLAMTRSLVDDLIYNEARNEVLLIKYLGKGQDS
jgi:anti-sigma regulatory factor (Ser/Thr protein kinase)